MPGRPENNLTQEENSSNLPAEPSPRALLEPHAPAYIKIAFHVRYRYRGGLLYHKAGNPGLP